MATNRRPDASRRHQAVDADCGNVDLAAAAFERIYNMQTIRLSEHELSGARLTIAFTPLGRLGPKHHAVIVGIDEEKQQLWIAELSRRFGHRLVSLEQWLEDNKKHVSTLKIQKNDGPRSNAEVAESAVAETIERMNQPDAKKYNLVFNNCETFAERHAKGSTQLSPQIVKTLQAAGVVVAAGVAIWQKQRRRDI